jgi:predicted Zn-dependent protease
MSRLSTIAQQALALIDPAAEAEVTVAEGTQALTRFANSYIHQNVAEEGPAVTVKVALGGRIASATSNRVGKDDLARTVSEAVASARLQPEDPEWPGLTAPIAVDAFNHWDEETASASPAARAEVVKAFVEAGAGLSAAGYCDTNATSILFANSAGHMAEDRFTSATLDGIHREGTAAGSGHAASLRLSDLDGATVGGLAARRARDSVGATDAKPGEYEVVLSPECVATICIFMAVYGFNAKAYEEGQSFVRLDEEQFDPAFRLSDDATDPRALRIGFDAEGTRKRRLDLVVDGKTVAIAHDRRTARKAGVESTGHGFAAFGGYFGPITSDLFVQPGDLSEQDLVAGVDRGLYVATFNYCRVLDPKTLVVTGLTRNGTFMIENGRITHPVTNLRFTQSFVEALGPGRVLAVGNDDRYGDSEFGSGLVHCPSLRLAAWNFTGGAAG